MESLERSLGAHGRQGSTRNGSSVASSVVCRGFCSRRMAWLQAQKIDLEEWLTKWIPGMEKGHRAVAVFPAGEGPTTTAGPLKLKNDLEEELAKIE